MGNPERRPRPLTKDEEACIPDSWDGGTLRACIAERAAGRSGAIAHMDPRSVIVDGVVKPPNAPLRLDGKDVHAWHSDKAGLTVIEFKDKMGHPRELAFKQPMGKDEHGHPIDNPLQKMADTLHAHPVDYGEMKFVRDGRGNTDYVVGNPIVQENGHNGPDKPRDLSIGVAKGHANEGVAR